MDISRWLEQNVGAPLLMLHDKRLSAPPTAGSGTPIPGGPSNLILHTVGAKTGQKRANTLSYARDGDDYLVVASKGGDPEGARLVSQPEGQSERRNQRRPKAIQCHGEAGDCRTTPTMRGCGRSSTT